MAIFIDSEVFSEEDSSSGKFVVFFGNMHVIHVIILASEENLLEIEIYT